MLIFHEVFLPKMIKKRIFAISDKWKLVVGTWGGAVEAIELKVHGKIMAVEIGRVAKEILVHTFYKKR